MSFILDGVLWWIFLHCKIEVDYFARLSMSRVLSTSRSGGLIVDICL